MPNSLYIEFSQSNADLLLSKSLHLTGFIYSVFNEEEILPSITECVLRNIEIIAFNGGMKII